jgi:ABC-2 type transport system permease protein
MNHWKAVSVIAGWEFRRFFKIRDLLIGIGFGVAAGVFFGAMQLWVATSQQTILISVSGITAEEMQQAVSGQSGGTIGLAEIAGSRFRFIDLSEGESPAELVRAGDVSGHINLLPTGDAELTVMKEPTWTASLRSTLSEMRREREVAKLGVNQEDLEEATRSAKISVVSLESETDDLGGRMIVALVSVVLVMFATITATSYMFICITGEKQQRVTEQVIAAVSPHAWVDGKIIGLSLVAFACVLVYVVPIGIAIVAIGGQAIAGGFLFQPGSLGILLQVLLISLLGVFFWLAFLAAIAATINDPNTSSKNSFMVLPMLAAGSAFVAMGNPSGLAVEALSIFPLTSFAVMPMRLVLTDVPLWQYLLSIVLLLGSVWVMRWVAGRIFTVAVLMYGKEPSLREVMRWIGGKDDAKAP